MRIFRSGWTPTVMVALFLLLGLFGGTANQWEVATNTGLLRYRLANPGLTKPAIFITELGGAYATIGLGIVAALLLVVRRQLRRAAFLAVGITAARLASDGLKLVFDRPRPKFDLPEVVVSSSSYPSGHSANSMAIYLMIALAISSTRHRPAALALAASAAILIGLTRPYLGVHWPTDILGGWALGLIAVWLFVRAGEASGVLPLEQQHEVVGGHGAPLDEAETVR